jgi:hypothetical protein
VNGKKIFEHCSAKVLIVFLRFLTTTLYPGGIRFHDLYPISSVAGGDIPTRPRRQVCIVDFLVNQRNDYFWSRHKMPTVDQFLSKTIDNHNIDPRSEASVLADDTTLKFFMDPDGVMETTITSGGGSDPLLDGARSAPSPPPPAQPNNVINSGLKTLVRDVQVRKRLFRFAYCVIFYKFMYI